MSMFMEKLEKLYFTLFLGISNLINNKINVCIEENSLQEEFGAFPIENKSKLMEMNEKIGSNTSKYVGLINFLYLVYVFSLKVLFF